jgi:predicted dithiol-disulfide oxidoreductase (DUF899 family)
VTDTSGAVARPPVVSAEEWQRQRDELLRDEKQATRTLDALAAKRRRLPMVSFDNGYVFDTPDGPKTLLDLFDGRGQLVGFADDTGAGDLFRLSVFLRNRDDLYLTYSTTARGVDRLLFANNILDLTPYGRQEDWEDSPPGWPQHPTYG